MAWKRSAAVAAGVVVVECCCAVWLNASSSSAASLVCLRSRGAASFPASASAGLEPEARALMPVIKEQ